MIENQGYLKNVWFLYNEVFNSARGVSGYHSTGPGPTYVIGNVIHDLVRGTAPYTYGIAGGSTGPIVGNTIYNVDVGIRDNTVWADSPMYNNIISNCSEYHICSNDDIDHNLFWQNGEPITVYGSNAGEYCVDAPWPDENSVIADPLFVDAANGDFSLQSTSPAIDTGVESDVYQTFYDLYGIDIRKDIEGRARPLDGDLNGTAEWDIGAYEYV